MSKEVSKYVPLALTFPGTTVPMPLATVELFSELGVIDPTIDSSICGHKEVTRYVRKRLENLGFKEIQVISAGHHEGSVWVKDSETCLRMSVTGKMIPDLPLTGYVRQQLLLIAKEKLIGKWHSGEYSPNKPDGALFHREAVSEHIILAIIDNYIEHQRHAMYASVEKK